jgi:hypothetical protein
MVYHCCFRLNDLHSWKGLRYHLKRIRWANLLYSLFETNHAVGLLKQLQKTRRMTCQNLIFHHTHEEEQDIGSVHEQDIGSVIDIVIDLTSGWLIEQSHKIP